VRDRINQSYGVYFKKQNRTIRRKSEQKKVGKTQIFKEVFISSKDNSQIMHPFDKIKNKSQRKLTKQQQEAIFEI
jgi:hypothetical protein